MANPNRIDPVKEEYFDLREFEKNADDDEVRIRATEDWVIEQKGLIALDRLERKRVAREGGKHNWPSLAAQLAPKNISGEAVVRLFRKLTNTKYDLLFKIREDPDGQLTWAMAKFDHMILSGNLAGIVSLSRMMSVSNSPVLAEYGTHNLHLLVEDQELDLPSNTVTRYYRVLVSGSRTWTDEDLVHHEMHKAWLAFTPKKGIVSADQMVLVVGDCPTGADRMAHEYAVESGWGIEQHVADWNRWHRAAGPKRNQEMVSRGADIGLFFIRAGSKGASGCLKLAELAGMRTKVFRADAQRLLYPKGP